MTQDETQGERLNQLISCLEKNQSLVAQELSISQSYINQIIKGKKNLSHKVITEIGKKYPMVNTNWLIRGEGDMFLSEKLPEVAEPETKYFPENPPPADPLSALSALLKYQQERIDNLEKRLSKLEGRLGGKE